MKRLILLWPVALRGPLLMPCLCSLRFPPFLLEAKEGEEDQDLDEATGRLCSPRLNKSNHQGISLAVFKSFWKIKRKRWE
jgi:hypothetical protein